ncbi:MAG TPA: TlyA family RNA methyltransferase [Candidatus Acidoferrum sp.]|nr:TlyA family RNA methyltransferase [Candidatus Acidoferrum sp.]
MPSKPAKPKTKKARLDVLLVERGLAETRQKAQAMLLAGEVRVNGQRADKAGARVSSDATIDLIGERPRYVSRGGIKLEGALEDFAINPAGKACLDVGSSTGGFTDCLLQHGAPKVYAVDVSPEQLSWNLQKDPRVIQIQRNARELSRDDLPESPQLITLDVSFISAAKVLPAVTSVAGPGAEFLILVKPQFELDRGDVGKGGIISDPKLHERAIERVRAAAIAAGLAVEGVKPSRLAGAEGNQEFFLHARRP